MIIHAERDEVVFYATAHAAMCANAIAEYQAGVQEETDRFNAINALEWLAAARVPWWTRQWIDRRVERDLDYWGQMAGAFSFRPLAHLADWWRWHRGH
jgi:hypothetical protein